MKICWELSDFSVSGIIYGFKCGKLKIPTFNFKISNNFTTCFKIKINISELFKIDQLLTFALYIALLLSKIWMLL